MLPTMADVTISSSNEKLVCGTCRKRNVAYIVGIHRRGNSKPLSYKTCPFCTISRVVEAIRKDDIPD